MSRSTWAWACVTSAVVGGWSCGGVPVTATVLGSDSSRALRVVSGDTGDPVASASVLVAGHSTLTDGQGMVTVERAGEAEIRSERFLPRRTAALGGDITLWPRSDSYPESYVRALLYQRAYQTRETARGADGRLRRVVATWVAIVPDPAVWIDAGARHAHERAAEALTAATEGRVLFTVRSIPGALNIRSFVDRSLPSGDARAQRDLRGDAIVGGHIAYGSLAPARNARFVAHELGHILGLEHSVVSTDLMHFAVDRGRPPAFSPNERLTIRLLLQRSPGNRFPDFDPGVGDLLGHRSLGDGLRLRSPSRVFGRPSPTRPLPPTPSARWARRCRPPAPR